MARSLRITQTEGVSKIILADLLSQPTAKVEWDHKVVDVGQDEQKA